jgi:2-iminobutanoate/2-iminopropanoate deaminase
MYRLAGNRPATIGHRAPPERYSAMMASDNPNREAIRKIDLHPDKSKYHNWTFSSCVVAGDYVFTSFQAADPKLDITGQTEQCFANLREVLATADATLDDVVKVTILIRDVTDFQAMDDVYKLQFTNGYPARTTAFVARFIDSGARIQIDATAYRPRPA